MKKKYEYREQKYAVKIKTTGEITLAEIPYWKGIDEELKQMQSLVDGYIEVIRLPYGNQVMIIDEEGKIKKKDVNPYASEIYGNPDDYVVGDVLIMKANGTKLEPFSSREAYNIASNYEIDERIRGLR